MDTVATGLAITEDDLINALQAAQSQGNPEGAMTTAELSEKLKWSRQRVIGRLKQLKTQGRLEVTQKPSANLAGIVACVPAYRIKANEQTRN